MVRRPMSHRSMSGEMANGHTAKAEPSANHIRRVVKKRMKEIGDAHDALSAIKSYDIVRFAKDHGATSWPVKVGNDLSHLSAILVIAPRQDPLTLYRPAGLMDFSRRGIRGMYIAILAYKSERPVKIAPIVPTEQAGICTPYKRI